MRRRLRCLWIVVIVVVGVIGWLAHRHCQRMTEQARCMTCPPSSLPLDRTCDGKPSTAPGTLTNGLAIDAFDVPHNGLAVESLDVPHNGLGTAPLESPNQELLRQLAQHPLTRTMFSLDPGLWRPLLASAHAPDLVQYIVSCALDRGDHVDIPSQWAELDPVRHQLSCGFPGELGLCGAAYSTWAAARSRPGESTWTAQPATSSCLERVSACVLARVNAVEARVPISMRGDATRLLPRVPTQTEFRENHGTPIQSFQRCDRMCLWGDRVRRNCDWQPRYVGQCVRDPRAGAGSAPARQVQLRIVSHAPLRVRICKGIYGCDDTAPGTGAGPATAPVFAHGRIVEFPTYYGGQMIDQTAADPGATIAFDCPDDGPLVEDSAHGLLRTGYFSVMLGSLEPGVPLPAGADVAPAQPAAASAEPFASHDTYPAPEQHIFTYREGGFFGTVFSNVAAPAPPPNNKFACASEVWNFSAALTADRLCAGPMGAVLPGGCFGNLPGRCDVATGGAPRSCEPESGSGPEVYDSCRGPSAGAGSVAAEQWPRPYTTYLNHPCDFFATDDECVRYLDDPRAVAQRPPPRVSSPRSDRDGFERDLDEPRPAKR